MVNGTGVGKPANEPVSKREKKGRNKSFLLTLKIMKRQSQQPDGGELLLLPNLVPRRGGSRHSEEVVLGPLVFVR